MKNLPFSVCCQWKCAEMRISWIFVAVWMENHHAVLLCLPLALCVWVRIEQQVNIFMFVFCHFVFFGAFVCAVLDFRAIKCLVFYLLTKRRRSRTILCIFFFGWQLRCISWQWNRRAAVPFFVTLYNWLNHKRRRTDKVFHRLYEMTIWRKEMFTKRKWETFAFHLWAPLSSILLVLPNLNQ